MFRIVLVALIFVLIATLQVYLCKRESRKAGLILPSFFFIVSILAVFWMIFNLLSVNLISVLFTALAAFFALNVPTIVLMGIYMSYHGQRIEALRL